MGGTEVFKVMEALIAKQTDGESAYKAMEIYTNSLGCKKEFADAVQQSTKSVQDEWTRICFSFIRHLYDNYVEEVQYCGTYTDERNKASCEIAARIVPIIKDRGLVKKEELKFVELMAKSHKTIQQTFAGLCFYWLMVQSKNNEAMYRSELNEIIYELGDRFYVLPII